MKELTTSEMQEVEGGITVPGWLGCAVGIAGVAAFYATLFSNPVTAAGTVAGMWFFNATLGPTIAGVGAVACFG